MNGHTGWVRALATSGGRWLFSCGCNHLRQWDTTFTVPREVASSALFTGDILALAATERRVFTAGADGSVRAWAAAGGGGRKDGASPPPSPAPSPGGGKAAAAAAAHGSGGGGGGGGKEGELRGVASREKAHGGRVTSLAVAGSLLFSVSYDGRIKVRARGRLNGRPLWRAWVGVCVCGRAGRAPRRPPRAGPPRRPAPRPAPSRAGVTQRPPPPPPPPPQGWDTETLNLVVERSAAHGGARISAAALGPDGLLYTGGDDGLVRVWDPVELGPAGPPLDGHGGAAVRVLAAGPPGGGCLVSGDASGEVAVWAL